MSFSCFPLPSLYSFIRSIVVRYTHICEVEDRFVNSIQPQRVKLTKQNVEREKKKKDTKNRMKPLIVWEYFFGFLAKYLCRFTVNCSTHRLTSFVKNILCECFVCDRERVEKSH